MSNFNELLSPADPVPEPAFNISWAIFFLNFPETLSVLVTHCLEIGNVYVSPALAEARQEVTEPSFCVAAWHGFTAAPDR